MQYFVFLLLKHTLHKLVIVFNFEVCGPPMLIGINNAPLDDCSIKNILEKIFQFFSKSLRNSLYFNVKVYIENL